MLALLSLCPPPSRFHYVIEHNWIYLCICDLKYQRMLAFQFLNSLIEFIKSQAHARATAPTPALTALPLPCSLPCRHLSPAYLPVCVCACCVRVQILKRV